MADRWKWGRTVRIAYFSQELPQMDTEQRVIDYVKDIGEYVQTKEGRISASQMLERFLFTPGNAVFSGRKAVRRREEAPLSAWDPAVKPQFPRP